MAQATVVARIVDGVFLRHEAPLDERTRMVALAGLIAVRASLSWCTEVLAGRCAGRVKAQLRTDVAMALATCRPAGGTGEVLALLGPGVDALDVLFSRYLTQLVLAVTVPLLLGGWLMSLDPLTGVVLLVTVPLIPLFMILIGRLTERTVAARVVALEGLAGHFLDIVRGLPTLRAFGRGARQVQGVRRAAEELRRATMANLRIVFLSALVLELLSMLGVAIVAVSMGLRLVDGRTSLQVALTVLLLAPEVFLPIRQVGAQFHANAEGMAAFDRVIGWIDASVAGRPSRNAEITSGAVSLERVTFSWPDRPAPVLDAIDLDVRSGEVVLLAGQSGSGKSTLLALVLGLENPSAGVVRVDGHDLAEIEPGAWRARIGWVPQRAHMFSTSVLENVRLGAPGATVDDVRAALVAANASDLVDRLPDGITTRIGEGGHGLSAGERQRIAIARAIVRQPLLVVLDEPTAHLDEVSERKVMVGLSALLVGRTAIVVSHRPALRDLADRAVLLDDGAVHA